MFGFMKNPNQIDCPQARQLVEQGAQLVDVRTPQEYAQGAIPGSVNLPLQMIQGAKDKLDSNKPVIVYCVSGARSSQAQMFLENMGFNTVHNLGSIRKYLTC